MSDTSYWLNIAGYFIIAGIFMAFALLIYAAMRISGREAQRERDEKPAYDETPLVTRYDGAGAVEGWLQAPSSGDTYPASKPSSITNKHAS